MSNESNSYLNMIDVFPFLLKNTSLISFLDPVPYLAMLSRTSFLAMLLVFFTVLMQDSGCSSYQLKSYPLNTSYQMMRKSHLKEDDDSSTFPKMETDIFDLNSDDSSDHSRQQEENDSSVSLDEV